MTMKAQILTVLMEGPATTPEMVAETGLPRKHCCAILRDLWIDGFITRELFRQRPKPRTFLYSIPEKRT